MRGSGRTASLSAEWPQRRRRRRTRPTVCSAAQPAPGVWAQCLLSGCHHRLGGGVRCGCLRDISRTSSAARLFIHMIRSGCAASESSSPSRIGGSTTTSTLPSSARDASARIGPPPESGRITTGRSRHPDRDHRGPAAAQHHTVGDLEHVGDGGGHASVQSHDGELVRHGSTVARSVGGWHRTGRVASAQRLGECWVDNVDG